MKSKEALERLLKNIVVNETILITKYGYSALNDIETIKQDLDRLEKLEKVIEILKEKIIDKCKILNSKNVEEYNNYVLCGFDFFDILTQEEYNLLKEVLGND